MAIIDPALGARVRQLLGLRGAPTVEADTVVQPTILVASWGGIERNPPLEVGDQIPISFVAEAQRSPAAGQFAQLRFSTDNTGQLVWIRDLWIANLDTANAALVQWGRADSFGIATFGTVQLIDGRHGPGSYLNLSAGIGSRSAVATLTITGGPQIQLRAGETQHFRLDWALVPTNPVGNNESLTVQALTADRNIAMSVFGRVMDIRQEGRIYGPPS